MDRAQLQMLLEHLSPGEWSDEKFEQLASSLGEKDGWVNVSKLFQPDDAFTVNGLLKVAIFSAEHFVTEFMAPFLEKFPGSFFVEQDLNASTAHLCEGANAICVFVNDIVDSEVIKVLQANRVKLILLRCAGFDRVDLQAAERAGIKVARVPAYSPYAVAEHAVSLVVTLNRRLHIACNRIKSSNYELSGLVGMDLYGKTCGIFGTGKIGQIAAKIFKGFGMRVICYDVFENSAILEMGCQYCEFDDVLRESDVISLHVPLLPTTTHMINRKAIRMMKPGVILVNVARGGLVDTDALIEGLSVGIIRAVGLDVYEEEADLFFKDFSNMDDGSRMKHWDQRFSLLRSFPNALITPHTAFLTSDALRNILGTTLSNAEEFASGKQLSNEVKALAAQAPAAPAQEKETRKPSRATPLVRHRGSVMYADPPGFTAPNPDFKVAVFSTTQYVRVQMKPLLEWFPNSFFVEATASASTANLCNGAQAVCLFVNDDANREVLSIFQKEGVQLVLLRCAGFDRVDLTAAEEFGIKVTRVAAYSPYAVAEHAVSLCMCLNRRLHRCYNRVQEGIFVLSGLVGKDLNGKVCGILGTGKIGQIAARIFKGLGMEVICYDVFQNDVITKELGLKYVETDEIYERADVISLHVPLLPATKYMINEEAVSKMKPGVILINVSRGALVHTPSLVQGLASGKIGGAGLDVYENEQDIFFKNFSEMDDDERLDGIDHQFMHLRSLPNVLVTPHTAFLTQEALVNICGTTLQNLKEFVAGKALTNEVKAKK
eukprot:CAMPEP_0179037750 /NCGR_PEP_ID=MMETSP0796-20121207/14286_1 /TAXON_ID=73915 /ORGANISM="Pyrodinium bahamense, Strain pbaha01" /LENGTH=772 /DNA_ID=CAMNT_0020734061 /DNA_START=45 /DNA_END=2363 /DNA_ORIENTATION=+